MVCFRPKLPLKDITRYKGVFLRVDLEDSPNGFIPSPFAAPAPLRFKAELLHCDNTSDDPPGAWLGVWGAGFAGFCDPFKVFEAAF